MDRPITTRIAHARGEHDGEWETHASMGCQACYRIASEARDWSDRADAAAENEIERRATHWFDRDLTRDFTAYFPGLVELN